MSTRLNLTAALKAALSNICIASGYNTDAGAAFFESREFQLAPPDKPALVLWPGEIRDGIDGEPPPSQGEENHFMSFELEGFIDCDEIGTEAYLLRDDMMKALKVDQFFGGLSEGYSGSISSSITIENNGDGGFLGYVKASFTLFYVTLYGAE